VIRCAPAKRLEGLADAALLIGGRGRRGMGGRSALPHRLIRSRGESDGFSSFEVIDRRLQEVWLRMGVRLFFSAAGEGWVSE
jgi:hypothetical protein